MILSVILCVSLIFTSCTSALQTLGNCGRQCGDATEPDKRIKLLIGGEVIESPRPWAVLLLQRGQPVRCGGFLINRSFVLTVKHLQGEDMKRNPEMGETAIQCVQTGRALFRKRKWRKVPWFSPTTRWCWCNKITQQCLVAMLKKLCLMFCHLSYK